MAMMGPVWGQATRPTSSPSINEQLAAALRAIDAKVSQIKDLRADFRQEKQTALLKKPLISSGSLLVKGSRTLWKTVEPEPTEMLIDAKEIQIFYPREKVLEIYPIQGQLGALAASPLPRLEVLEKFFSFEGISVTDLKPDGSEEQYLAVKLTPMEDSLAKHVRQVEVLLDRDSGFVMEARTLDTGGDKTTLRFSHFQANSGLKDSALELHVPKGTTISRPLEGVEGAGR
jgi:outer membrane lipoprotein-sorting protein